MLLIDTKIKPFSATAFRAGEEDFITITNDDLIGKWSVFFFYPADFTYVCPTELGDLADNYEKFKTLGAEILAISTDSHFCHKAWYDASETIAKIKYAMVSDNTLNISRNFQILRENEGRSERGTFIVDPDGFIKAIDITCEGIGRDAGELLRKLSAAQYIKENPGQVCPAKWRAGETTLTPALNLVGKI